MHTLSTIADRVRGVADRPASVVRAAEGQHASAAPAKPMEAAAGKTYTLSGESLRGYQNVQANLAEAAEKMPEEHYGFKPTPEVKPFGQHVAHIALSQYGLCSRLKGEPNPKKDEKEETTRSKADAVALLKGSAAYCEPLVTGLTDASADGTGADGTGQGGEGADPHGPHHARGRSLRDDGGVSAAEGDRAAEHREDEPDETGTESKKSSQ